MKAWLHSGSCRSRLHCRTCRDLAGGRAWRLMLGRAYTLPTDAPDFACPHGLAWGDLGGGVRPHNGLSLLAQRLAICDACGEWDGPNHRCGLDPRCTRCYLRRPGTVCPAEPPRWLPVVPAAAG